MRLESFDTHNMYMQYCDKCKYANLLAQNKDVKDIHELFSMDTHKLTKQETWWTIRSQ